jgi:isoleucyl-tRNA synthetase
VPLAELLEVDRYALSRTAQLQADIVGHYNATKKVFEGGHFGVYEFHPVVAKLQIFCSEDLGAFYLDVLKDRLYTSAPQSLARRSAQTALWHITQAMLRWMAPFLSFTAEEAWTMLGNGKSIFTNTYLQLPEPDADLLAKWARIKEIRDFANKKIEDQRTTGLIGSPLQAYLYGQAPAEDLKLLTSLGDDIKFVFITSKVELSEGSELDFAVDSAAATGVKKCDRCWHYPDFPNQVGKDAKHPTLCSRCDSNLHGAGETRSFA